MGQGLPIIGILPENPLKILSYANYALGRNDLNMTVQTAVADGNKIGLEALLINNLPRQHFGISYVMPSTTWQFYLTDSSQVKHYVGIDATNHLVLTTTDPNATNWFLERAGASGTASYNYFYIRNRSNPTDTNGNELCVSFDPSNITTLTTLYLSTKSSLDPNNSMWPGQLWQLV